MISPPFRVGDLVTPSHYAKNQKWWSTVRHLNNAQLMVTKVLRAKTFDGWIVRFHDPYFGERGWSSIRLELVNFSLENE